MIPDTPIRAVGAPDAAVLAVLHGACFPDEPWQTQAMSEVLAMPGAFGFLALDMSGAAPTGFVVALDLGDACEILALGVLAAARRRGIARRLMAAVLARAAGRPVLLEVAEDNTAAIALYAAADFAVVGRRAAYYRRRSGAPAAALALRRPAGE